MVEVFHQNPTPPQTLLAKSKFIRLRPLVNQEEVRTTFAHTKPKAPLLTLRFMGRGERIPEHPW